LSFFSPIPFSFIVFCLFAPLWDCNKRRGLRKGGRYFFWQGSIS
jgi:hypothetical protein